jgi:hypothetical protein
MLNKDKIHSYTVAGLVGAYQPKKDIVLFAATAKELHAKMWKFLETLDLKNKEHRKYKERIMGYFKEHKIENLSYS